MPPPPDYRPFLPRLQAIEIVKRYKALVETELVENMALAQSEYREYNGSMGPLMKQTLKRIEAGKATAEEKRSIKQKAMGDLAFKEGRLHDASLHYQKAFELPLLPHSPDLQNNMCLLGLKLDEFHGALSMYRAAVLSHVAIHGDGNSAFLAKAHYRGGMAKKGLGNWEGALFALRQAEKSSSHGPVIQKEIQVVSGVLALCRQEFGDDRRAEYEARFGPHVRAGLTYGFRLTREEGDLLFDAGVMPWDDGAHFYLRAARGDLGPLFAQDLNRAGSGSRRAYATIRLSARYFRQGPNGEQSPLHPVHVGEERHLAPKDPEKRYICAGCGNSTPGSNDFKKCARCFSVLYCSKDCQRSHWEKHKPHCSLRSNAATTPFFDNLTEADIQKYVVGWSSRRGNKLSKVLKWAINLRSDPTAFERNALSVTLDFQPRATNTASKFLATAVGSTSLDESQMEQWKVAHADAQRRGKRAGLVVFVVSPMEGSKHLQFSEPVVLDDVESHLNQPPVDAEDALFKLND